MKTLLMLLFLYLLPGIAFTASRIIAVDLGVTFQSIDHFGASDCWSFQKIGEWNEAEKNRVADLLFSTTKGIGLSGWRFNLGGGINTQSISHPWRTVETFYVGPHQYDWTKQAKERWFLQAAKERGVQRFTAFVNSPPRQMTLNGLTNCTDGRGSTNLKNGYEWQFATYLVDVLKHFRDEWGITFDYISPVNEPQWEWNSDSNQEGNRAANADIINIVNALYDELQKQGVSTQISIVESGDLQSWYMANRAREAEYGKKYGDYLRQVIGNEEISGKIAHHFCGHSYWSDRLDNQLIQHRETAKRFFRRYLADGWQYLMTEYCILDGPEGAGGHGRDLSIKTALDVARVIHYDLTILNASAWNWWTAVSPEDYKDGLLYTNYKDNPNDQSVIESKTLWALGNFSRFIRPGATRVNVSGADDKESLMASAYLSQDQNSVIIVVINVKEVEMPASFQFQSLREGETVKTLTPYLTSDRAGDDLRALPAFAATEEFVIPPRSIVTFVGEIESVNRVGRHDRHQPANFILRCFPNPFNSSVAIISNPGTGQDARMSIIDVTGQMIADLGPVTGRLVRWDGMNQRHEPAPSGVYFVRLQTRDSATLNKIALVR